MSYYPKGHLPLVYTNHHIKTGKFIEQELEEEKRMIEEANLGISPRLRCWIMCVLRNIETTNIFKIVRRFELSRYRFIEIFERKKFINWSLQTLSMIMGYVISCFDV